MTPQLTTRGKWVLASTLLFVAAGASIGAPALAALGGVLMVVLLAWHAAFYPVAIMLRRKKIELSWWVAAGEQASGTVVADRPFTLHLAYRNHGSRMLRVLATRILASSAVEVETPHLAAVGPGMQVETTTQVTAHAAGVWQLHGAGLVFGEPLGLFEIEAYFPNPVALRVYPRGYSAGRLPVRSVGAAPHEFIGIKQTRRRGLAGELRELRDHQHGDSLRYVAWKASARRRRLMVRDLDTEIISTQLIVLDVGGNMRQGPHGAQALDWALATATALVQAAATRGDRIGLVAFDTRSVFTAEIAAGRLHYLHLADQLLMANGIVDDDLTDLTSGELVAQVAHYFAHQEALDVRVATPPVLTDPQWNSIVAGPDGNLYDVAACGKLATRLVDAALTRDKRGQLRRWLDACRDSDTQLRPLRQLCRLRGIELPFRTQSEHGRRSVGFANALEPFTTRIDDVFVLSNLAGLEENEEAVLRALGKLRQRGTTVSVLTPQLPAPQSQALWRAWQSHASVFAAPAARPQRAAVPRPPLDTAQSQRMHNLLHAEWQQRTQPLRRRLAMQGVHVRAVSPT